MAITERYPGKGSFGIMCLSSQLPKSMNNTYKRAHFVGNKANGRISKRLFQENKQAKFSEKRTFLTPRHAQVRPLRLSDVLLLTLKIFHTFF